MGRYSNIGWVMKDSGGKWKKASRKRRKTSAEVSRVYTEVKHICLSLEV